MSGTRKLEKFDPEPPASRDSHTQKLERFVPPAEVIATPVAQPSPAMLDAARPSTPLKTHGARAVDREQGVERLRTRLARKFTTLADEVTDAFADLQIGAGAWTVQLTAPEGMSTSGGKQALQHLRLRPKRQGHVVLIGGIVNPVTKTADLRDHGHMTMLYAARFGRELEITTAEWEQFLRKAEVVLQKEGIATKRVAAPRDVVALARNADGAWKRTAAACALGVIVVAAAIVAWRVFVALSESQ